MLHIHLNHPKHMVLVDGNNFAINRFHAGRSCRDLMNEIANAPGNPIVVFDGSNGNAKRREFFPDYKVHPPEVMKAKESLWPSLELFRNLVPLSKAIVVRVPRWEADDVIATIARTRHEPTVIVSTDRDFAQLGVYPHVTPMAPLEGVSADEIRLYKTFVGDSSDRIPGVPGFGPKSWEDAFHQPLLEAMETGGPITPLMGLKPKQYEWCQNNRALLDAYYKIVGFFEVPMETISKHTLAGVSQLDTINDILKGLFM